MIKVWMFMVTGDLFTVEELDDGFRISIGSHLDGLFSMNSKYFMECSVCIGDL